MTFGKGPLLIIAGAGTGKTTVLTRRIVWLIEQGLAKPEEILALTFTEKAAKEMEERVDLLMPLGYADINISTFHAFAQKILQQHALDIGLPGDFRVITDTQAWMLVKKHLYDFDLDYYKPVGNPNKFIHSLLKHFSKAKGQEIAPEEYLKYAQGLQLNLDDTDVKKTRKKKTEPETHLPDEQVNSGLQSDPMEVARINEVANAYHKYQMLLLDNGYLDFGDLINYTLKLFRTRPKILNNYQRQFKYILVDEFQDTDLSQYQLVRLLASPENNITVVGDDDQSIYKFRGASISNILKFKEDYKQASEITLTKNYRSTQAILDLSYDFIQQNNPQRLEAKLKISKKLVSDRQLKGEIQVLHASTVYEEVTLVAEKMAELKERDSLSFNDFAILVRANDHAEPFLVELAKRGLPYIFVANRGLYKKPFILDIMAYLKLLDNYYENENLFRVLNMRKFKINEDDLIQITQTAKRRTLSLYEVIRQVPGLVTIQKDSQEKTSDLLANLSKHSQQARNVTISELIVRTLQDLGLIKGLTEDSAENSENREVLEQFYRKIQSYEKDNEDKSLKGFLSQIRLELEAGDQGELAFNPDLGPDAIRVMTIHSSKGLEFACVFVVNMAEQRFPSRDRKEQIEVPQALVKEIMPEGDIHLMEERRLFYVAATRAKQFLYLTWSDDYGGATHKKPSRFLVELGLEQRPFRATPVGQVYFQREPGLPRQAAKLRVPETFSFSQINCFLNCPLEFKFRYIYQLPLPGAAQLSFGDTIHKTLEKYLNHYIQLNSRQQADLFGVKKNDLELPAKELLQKHYSECWVDDWYQDKIQKQAYQKKGLKMLESFFDRLAQGPKPVKFLEKRFRLKLGDYKFTGKIDRADQNSDGTIEIIDYKTGQMKEKLSPEDKTQLLVYQWAAEEEFKERVRSLSYWYLADLRDSVEFLGSKQDIEDVKEKILNTIRQIVAAVETNNFAELDRRISHTCQFRHLEG